MPKHMTIINLACTITKLRKWGQAWKYSAESAQNAASQLTAEHERKLTEHRAAFGARTEADAKIIAGLREERDGLLTQVQDMRAALANEQELHAATALRLSTEAVKLVERKHPVKVGEWLRRTGNCYDDAPHGFIVEVLGVQTNPRGYTYTIIDHSGHRVYWSSEYCEPCDPPATHATPEGKASAEAAVKTEPVADEIKAGDLVEVFQRTSSETLADDVSIHGTVSKIFWSGTGTKCVRLIPETMNRRSRGDDYFSYCDVRKVTT